MYIEHTFHIRSLGSYAVNIQEGLSTELPHLALSPLKWSIEIGDDERAIRIEK
ncbi:hypothetical protein M422DRAFT_276923 [Sphaerobolus stellatus SS14]|uniref:Uncharacterized protein n=1 Tax=Sphaerobolus stellatus (strain SS14) TaxID=990650 RepID=A0A0C9TL74_SPHS4|nr:hypothetical protein M422DRAFT_276925 [Sphaerobolus stellatus SS14]KIJ22619.1 hypothetical protein M422DRAFT_276923 [Sphaerobolus stellatus SS14]